MNNVTEIPPEFLTFHNAELVVGSVTLAVNGILMYFIVCKTPPELIEYRSFLFLITMADILLDIMMVFVIRPVFILPVLGAIITGPIKVFGYSVAFYIAFSGLWLWFFSSFCINLAFLYRYACIVHPDSLRPFLIQKATYGCLIFAICALCTGSVLFPILNQDTPELIKYLVGDLIPTFVGHVDEFVVVTTKGSFWILPNAICPFLFSCTLNVVLGFRIISKLHSLRASFSSATYKMHYTLVTCLLCQTFMPFVLLSVPIFIIGGLVLSGAYWADTRASRMATDSVVLIVALHPLLNALCAFIFIRPYRVILQKWPQLLFPKYFVSPSNASSQHHRSIVVVGK